jgi:formate-dependent nitrite reductase cytochrome c552 subunit
MQVLDDERHPDGKSNFPLRTAGSLYDMIGKGMKDKKYHKAGEWNHVRIVCKDNNVEHWLNGEKLLSYKWGSEEIDAMIKKSKFSKWTGFMKEAKGRIAIQHHGEEVWYRNIRVRGN